MWRVRVTYEYVDSVYQMTATRGYKERFFWKKDEAIQFSKLTVDEYRKIFRIDEQLEKLVLGYERKPITKVEKINVY